MSTLDIYVQEMGRYPLLNESEETERAALYQQGRKAGEQLVQAPGLEAPQRRRLDQVAVPRRHAPRSRGKKLAELDLGHRGRLS